MTAVAAAPVVLSAGDLEATFAPERGMLGTSLRHRGAELLDRTGGIPLLHPWANRLTGLRVDSPLLQRDEHGLPIHGLLMGWPHWELPVVSTDRLRARLDFGAHPELLAAFPFPHELELDVALRLDALTVTTTVTATGDVAVPVSFGYHPYLRLPGVPRAAWEIGFPARRHLVADERLIPTGAVDPQPAERFRLGARTFDDGYDGLRTGAAFTVAGGGRRAADRRPVRARLPGRAGVRAGRRAVHLLRADDRADERAAQRRRAAPGGAGRPVHGGVLDRGHSNPSSRARPTAWSRDCAMSFA
jgi:aldose 1-epimerase